ncbi:MAG: sterol desaturase family protein [Myxococcota bacterium]|nr:sterol desaturase family protein [Myxococcota bacterium]
MIFPFTLVAALWAAQTLLGHGSPPSAVIVIYFALMPYVALLERLLPRYPDWNRSHDDLGTDLIYFPVTMLVAGILSGVWTGLYVGVAGELQAAVGSPLWPDTWPLIAQIALACAAAEFFAYWPHRWMHENPFLWRFHSIHHSSTRVYWLNAARAHPGEHVFRGFISGIPLVVLGAPPEIFAYFMVLSRVGGLFQHANIDFELGPFAWIFSSGELHRWHHSAVREEADHNYGDTFIFWDTLFGTRYLPADRRSPEEVGIRGLEAFPKGWWQQQLAPFRYAAIERESRSPR